MITIDPSSLLAPDLTTASKAVVTAFGASRAITQECHQILNTVLVPPHPKPAWFDQLTAPVDQAKSSASTWVNEVAPDVTGEIPSSIINYSPTVVAFAGQFGELLKPLGSAPLSPAQQTEMNQLLGGLKDSLDSSQQSIASAQSKTISWAGGETQVALIKLTLTSLEADMAIVSMWNALQLGLDQAKDKVAHLSADQLLAALGVDTAKQTWDDLAEKAQQLIS